MTDHSNDPTADAARAHSDIPALADQPAELIEQVADIFVEASVFSTSRTPSEIRDEFVRQLERARIRLADDDFERLLAKLLT